MTNRSTLIFDTLAIDRTLAQPLHRQIYELLRGYILGGRLAAGSSLPATRTLAQHLGVGRNTVVAAYEQLLAEGYLEAGAGSGTWVAPLPQRAMAARPPSAPAAASRISRRGDVLASRPQPARNPNTINLHPGFPDITQFPFASWARLLARNAQRRSADMFDFYQFAGHAQLREAIAGYLRVARGVDCAPEQVVVVTGAQAALDLVARLVTDEGDTAWMEEPGYLGARSALLGSGARLAPLRARPQGWGLADAALPRPRLIYVTPSCQWPLGTIMRMEERLQLLELAERHDAWIVEDDYDGEYRFRGRPAPAMQGLDRAGRVIYIGTFGKTLFQSLRLGFLVAPPALCDSFNRAVSVTGQFAPLLIQVTLADFIRQGYFASHLKRMRRLYARRQERFVELCQQHLGRWMTVVANDSGIQLLGRFTRPLDDRAVAAAALAQGVDVQPISINYHHDAPEHGLLMGYAGLDERQTLAAIAALQAAFRSLAA